MSKTNNCINNSSTDPLFVYVGFHTSVNTLQLGCSRDGHAFDRMNTVYYAGVGNGVRDPNILCQPNDPTRKPLKVNGYYWLAHTSGNFGNTNYFTLAKSLDLLNWTLVGNIPITGVSGTVSTTWSPDWYTDGTNFYMLIRVSNQAGNNYGTPGLGYLTMTNSGAFLGGADPTFGNFTTGLGLPTNYNGLFGPYLVGSVYYLFYDDAATCRYATSNNPISGYVDQGPVATHFNTDIVPNGFTATVTGSSTTIVLSAVTGLLDGVSYKISGNANFQAGTSFVFSAVGGTTQTLSLATTGGVSGSITLSHSIESAQMIQISPTLWRFYFADQVSGAVFYSESQSVAGSTWSTAVSIGWVDAHPLTAGCPIALTNYDDIISAITSQASTRFFNKDNLNSQLIDSQGRWDIYTGSSQLNGNNGSLVAELSQFGNILYAQASGIALTTSAPGSAFGLVLSENLMMQHSNNGTNLKNWSWGIDNNGVLELWTRNDNLAYANNWLNIDHATGALTANGSGLTALNASNLASGTVPAARMPALTGDVTTTVGTVATTVGKINGTSLAGLATGILQNTTTTGVPSIVTIGGGLSYSAGTLTATGFTGNLSGDVTGPQSATVVGKINGTSLAGLGTGPLWNTTGTGVPSIETGAQALSVMTGATGTLSLANTTLTLPATASTTGAFQLNSGSNGNIKLAPNGTGIVDLAATTILRGAGSPFGTSTGCQVLASSTDDVLGICNNRTPGIGNAVYSSIVCYDEPGNVAKWTFGYGIDGLGAVTPFHRTAYLESWEGFSGGTGDLPGIRIVQTNQTFAPGSYTRMLFTGGTNVKPGDVVIYDGTTIWPSEVAQFTVYGNGTGTRIVKAITGAGSIISTSDSVQINTSAGIVNSSVSGQSVANFYNNAGTLEMAIGYGNSSASDLAGATFIKGSSSALFAFSGTTGTSTQDTRSLIIDPGTSRVRLGYDSGTGITASAFGKVQVIGKGSTVSYLTVTQDGTATGGLGYNASSNVLHFINDGASMSWDFGNIGGLTAKMTLTSSTGNLTNTGNIIPAGIIYGSGGTPTAANGTNATTTVTGTNMDGTLQVVIAVGVSVGVITTLTLANSKTFPTLATMTLTPANAATATLAVTTIPFVTGTATTTVLNTGAVGLPIGTYLWNYHIGGY